MSKFIHETQYKYFFKYAVSLYCEFLRQRNAKSLQQEGVLEMFKIADMLYSEWMVREMKAKKEQRENEM